MKHSILICAGSLRKDSYNKNLAKHSQRILEDMGYQTTYLDLSEYTIPLYNQDLEQDGIPSDVTKLQLLWSQHSRYIIASPEYNGSISGVLKNVIDWMSRPNPALPQGASCFKGKLAGIMATSPGRLGGLRGLRHVREILSTLGTIVLPGDRAFGSASQILPVDGDIDPVTEETLRNLLLEWTDSMQKWYL